MCQWPEGEVATAVVAENFTRKIGTILIIFLQCEMCQSVYHVLLYNDRLKLGNACCRSVQNVLFYSLLSRKKNPDTQNCNFCC